MMRIMNVLMALWAMSTVNCFTPKIVRSFGQRIQSTLNAGLAVGDAVIAEVDDILGSVSDPKVSFLIRNEGKTTRASMSTKLLSSTERLALQTGSVMQVYVSKMDGDEMVQVALKPLDGSKPVVLRDLTTAEEKGTFRPVRVQTQAKKTADVAVSPKIPNGGLLLGTLKTGMELDGIVQSCTAYAAFVSANVFRAGKGGSFQAINGMLHKVDIVDKSFLTVGSRKSSSRSNRGYDSGANTQEGIISVGTRMKVYVKEVYKQSGRLTLTTDPTIDKLRVREQKEEIRSAGNDRRRARRLRRQLEKVAVGDTVSGVVQQVIPAGILVSVNSLGPLNVTGLIAKRDLPKQFEVPPDLKESFQKQLLEQDFAIGRQITCGVLQVNPNIGEKVAYNLKMLFEELGALAADTVPVKDSGEVSENSVDDEDETAQEVFDDSDLKEIFDELRGNKPLLSVQDLKDWGDIQDMIANNVIDPSYLEGAIQEVTGKPKGKAVTITFEQFVEVVDMLQDAMEGMTTDLDEFDENDDFEDDEIINSPAIVQPAPTIVAPPVNQKIKLVLEKIPENSSSEIEAKATNAAKDKVDPNMPRKAAIALDGFNLLKGENGKVSVKNLRASTGVLEMLEDGVVTPEQLDDIISSVAGDQKQVDFDLFFLIATKLDQTAEEGNLYLQSDGDDDGEDVEGSANEEDLKEVAKELFDELRGKDKKVSIAAFMAWEDVKDMIEDGLLTKEQMKEMISEVAGDKKQLDFDQFYEIVSQLDEIAEGAEEEDDETIEEVTRELFDELRGKNDQVSISAFKAWDDVKALTEAGLMSEAALNDAITSVLAGKKQINFENFVELINQLDELSDETEEVFDEADDDEDVDTKEDDDDENDDEDLEEVARELFDELRGKDKKVSVAAFMAWEDVKDMIKDGLLTKDEIKEIVSGVAGDKKQLDFEQFYDIVSQLDELAEGGDEEDDITDDEDDDESMEEVAKELFDELRGKNAGVTKAEFKAWDDVKEMLDDKLFTEDLLDEKINAVLAKKSTMNFEQFFKLVTSLDEIAQEAQQKLDDESDDDEDVDTKEDEDDEDDDEDLEEVARELFDELRGKDKKVSVAAFMAWEDVKDMIKDGLLTKDEIKEIVSGVAGDKKQLDFDQFYDIVSQLDELAEGGDEEDGITDDEDDDESMEEDELTEEDLKEMAKELFDELRGKDKKVSIAAFMAWGDVKDMIEDGLLTKDEIKEIVSEVAGDKKQLDFDQFYDIVSQLDEIAEDAEDDLTDDEDEDELTEEDLKEVAKELFDELRGKDKKVSIATFMASEDVKDMIEDGLLTKEQMKEMVSEVAGDKKQLDFEQFYDIVSQLDEIAEGAEDEDDLTDDEAEVQVESLESTKGFGSKTALSSKPIPLTAQNSASDEDDEFDGDFEDMSEEEVDEMLREVFDELKGKKGKTLTMKAFKKWEDIEEMLGTGIIDVQTIDDLAEKVGVKKGGDISYEQFKALVELLDEVAGEDDDSEEMSPTDERINDEDERIELDSNDIGGDGTGEDDEMTAEEIESMMKDIFNTLRGSKKTVSVATFLTWDNIQDMKDVIDDETINILLEEVGANRNRKGDLTYTQFSDLINLLEETVSALGDGEGIDTIMDDEDMDDEDEASAANVSATLEEREAIDAEISEERNERNVLDGIDDEGVDIIAKQIYESLKGESESLSVKAFLEWEDVSELIDQGIVKLSTVNLLIVEVGGAKTQTLTFDQFWQLVNLLEDASDAAADKVASGLDDSEDFDEDELEPSPEELEMMAKGIFDDLKNPKTGTVTAKKLKNWEGIKEVLDSGELSKGALNAAIKTVGAEKTNELDFKQFKELMDILEAAMDEGEMDEEPTEPVINASGKGFARAAEPAPVAAAMAAPVKAKNVPVPAAKAEKESEASMITREIYEELVGTGKSLSVDQLREWEDMQEMIEDGSLKRSTLEKALVKIGSLATGDISLKQFMQLIDIIQGAVDDSNLKFEYEDDVKDKDFKTSKKSSVLGSEDEEEENWGDDESGGDFEELTEEEAAQQAFDELVAEGASTISLVDFLQWEDVQDLLEAGALSKDDLATAIENAGVSLELDGIAFDKFYELLQVIDEFVDREKLPSEDGDVVFESKIIVDKDSNIDQVMSMVDGLIGTDSDEDNLNITYLSGKKGVPAVEGEAAIEAMQDDLDEEDDDEDEDEEVMEMFEELSKGKDYITEKALRKWDELQELIEADLATQEVIDSYMSRIEIKNGRVSLKAFKHFMRMLDMVIVDDSGNFLTMDDADRAVDIDALDDEDDEGETDDEEA